MSEHEIILRIEPIANGFLLTGSRGVGNYGHAELPQTYVATREEVVAGLTSLFEAAEALTDADAKEDF